MRKLIALLTLMVFPSVALSETLLERLGNYLNEDLNCYTCVTLEDFGQAGVAQIYHDWENSPLNSILVSAYFSLQRWNTVAGDRITVINPILGVEVDIDIDAVLTTHSFFGFSFTVQSYTKAIYHVSVVSKNGTRNNMTYKPTNRQIDLYTVIDPKGDRSNQNPVGNSLEVTPEQLQRLSRIGVTPEQYKRLSVVYSVEELENLAGISGLAAGFFDRFINMSDQALADLASLKNGNTGLNVSATGSGGGVFSPYPTTSFGSLYIGSGFYFCGSDCTNFTFGG